MKNLGLVIICLLLFSCQPKNIKFGTEGGIDVNLDILRGVEIHTSDLFKSAHTIILETKPECIVGNVDDILVFEREFYLLDKKGKSLFVFDMNGKFIRRIGKLGRGPGEYLYIFDFTIDPLNREIYVLDNGEKIHKYTVEGTYIKSIQIDPNAKLPYFTSIQFFDGKIYAAPNQLRNTEDHLLYVIAPATGEILSGHLSMKDNMEWNLPVMNSVFFNRLHGVPKFVYPNMNKILSLDDNTPLMTFESKNFLLVTEIEEIKKQFPRLSSAMRLKILQGIYNYMETEDLIFLCYFLNNKKEIIIYRKDEQNIYLANPFLNDLVYEKVNTIDIKCTDEKGAYEVVSMAQFDLYRNLILDNIDKREQLLDLKIEDANPVIFFYEFKDR